MAERGGGVRAGGDRGAGAGGAFTGGGFAPAFLECLFTQNTGAIEAPDNRAGSWGHGIATADEEFGNCTTHRDNQATSQTTSFSDDEVIRARAATGTGEGSRGTLTSLDADGWTINFSNVFGTPRYFKYLAVEKLFTVEAGSASGPVGVGGGSVDQVHELSAGIAEGPVGVGVGSIVGS